MRKELRKMFAILAAMFFLPFVLLAQNSQPEYGVVIEEGFENGIPETWTQEKVTGSIDWIVEKTNLTYPNGTAEGDARLAFRNTTGTTTKAVTRLILPAVDVAAYYQPIVVYSFAQEKWSGDCDRLRVLCRTSENGDWILLKQHDKYVSKWTVDTLFLPTENYCQIAFEAVDNLGRGVVLDNVIVRSTPSCFKPSEFVISNVSNDSAIVNWRGSYDAEYFDVKVSEVELTEKELESTSTTYVLDTVTEGIDMIVRNLEPGKKYYCYVKSHCENEVSGWASTTFETANIMGLPYKETFNMPYSGSNKVVSYLKGWYFFGSEELKPYINTNVSATSSILSYTTTDKTYSLVFTGGFATSDSYYGQIPGGSFVYAATPQSPCAVNRLQLSFQSVAFLIGAAERSSIVVGVMDDPLDRSTFVPVDTINITSPLLYEDFSVSFEKYEGNGKYIAFMSDFPESNRFTLDNLLIEERTDTLQKVNFDVRIPSATSIQLDFLQNYESYEVIVANVSVDLNDTVSAAKMTATNILVQKDVVNLEEITSEGMTPGATYYVYARAKKDSKPALWSRSRRVIMPKKLTEEQYPYLMTFENASTKTSAYNDYSGGTIVSEFKAVYDYPSSYNYYLSDSAQWDKAYKVWPKARSNKEFVLSADIIDSANVIAVFPEMNLARTKVGFYSTRRKEDVRTFSLYYVGIMSDANDQNSFVAIDTIAPTDDYAYYEFDLSAYSNIPGRFFAIKIDNGGGSFSYSPSMAEYDFRNVAYFDDIKISKVSDCKPPIDIEVEMNPENPEEVAIVWNPNAGKTWNVRVATTNYDKTKFDTKDGADFEFVYNQQVTSPRAELTGLDYPKVRYYYWIQPVCGESIEDWTEAYYFETQCRNSYPLPYEQNFDEFKAGSQQYEWPAYCLFATRWEYSKSGSYSNPSDMYFYPYVASTKSYNGENSFLLFKGKTSGSPIYRMYVAFPEMKAAVDSLQISFKMISGNTTSANWANQGISVGVMTDPTRYSSLEVVEQFTPTGTWKQYTTKFNTYAGEGLYIAIAADDRYTLSDSVYIDDVVIDYITPCSDIKNLKLFDVTSTTANVKWESDADSFVVVVSTEAYDILGLEMLDIDSMRTQPNIVLIDTITATSKFIEDLAINGKYYVYIKGICSGRYTEWSKELMFKTYCTSTPIEKFKADFSGDTNGQKPDCWICGSTGGTTSMDYSGTVKSNKLFLRTTASATANGAYAISPYFECDDISNYKVKFNATTSTSFMYPEHTGTRAYQKAVIVGVATDPYALETMVPVDTIYDILPESTPYEVYFDTYKYDLNQEKGHHVFFWSYFPIQNAVYIDDIVFERISDCPRFEFDLVSKTQTSVKFEVETKATAYEIKYATALQDTAKLNGTTLPSIQCASGEVEITGLNPHTRYYFYARATGNASCAEWTTPFYVETNDLDSVDLPYVDGFENQKYASYGQVPYNWTGLYMDNDLSYPYVSTSQKKVGSRSVEMYPKLGAPIYLVSPKLNVEDIANVRLKFSVYQTQSYERAVTVGVVSDINNIVNTFVPIDTVIFNKDMGWIETELIIGDYYKGSAKYIAFKGDDELNASFHTNNKNGAQFYIDEVTIEELPSCRYPENVLLKSITTNSVTVSFTHPGKALSYEVKCVSEGADPDVEAGKSQTATVMEVTVSDLASNATYDVYVRALCANDDKSPWIFVGTYTTLPDAVSTFPYECNFEDAEDAENWGFVHDSGKTRWFIGVDNDSVVADKVNSTDAALYVSGNATGTTAKKSSTASNAWAYRYLYLKEGTYTISYDWVCPGVLSTPDNSLTAGATYKDYMRVALVAATVNITSPTAMIDADGSKMDFTKNYVSNYPVPATWIEFSPSAKYGLYDYYGYAGTNTSLALDKQWQRETKHVDITKDQEGYYMLMFYWVNASGTESKVRSGAIDNVSIHSYTCNSPYNVKVNDYIHNEADLSWSTFAGSTQYEVRILSENVDPDEATAEQIVYNQTVTTKSVKATGLVPFTTHYAYVRALCSADDASEWSNPAVFKTLLAPFPEGHVYSFEEVEEIYYPKFVDQGPTSSSQNSAKLTASSASMFHNWYTRSQLTKETLFSFTKTNSVYYPQIVKNGVRATTAVEARTGEHALFFRHYQTSNTYGSGATVAMPYMGELENNRLVFYMRCFSGTQGTQNGQKVETQPNFTYAKGSTPSSGKYLDQMSRKITVGTMTDPNDATTFVALDTVQYPYNNQDYYINQSFKTKDPSNDHGWHRVVLPLDKAQGRFVAFRYEQYGTANTDIYNAVWIDDISLVPVGKCGEPYEVRSENLTARTAEINFNYDGSADYIIEVAETDSFTNVIICDTVQSLPIKLNGLEPETRYYVRVKAKCNVIDESDWAPTHTFVTPAEICFNVSFDLDSAGVKGWEFSQQPAPEKLFNGSMGFSKYTIREGMTYGWLNQYPIFASGMFSTRHMSIGSSSTGAMMTDYWMLSPIVALESDTEQHLIFDLAMTTKGANTPAGELAKVDPNSRFMVVISDDAGHTWKEENAVTWSMAVGDDLEHSYEAIPFEGKQYSIDLAKYKGKNIRVAFYHSTRSGVELHMDNVHINRKAADGYSTALCEFEDYEDENFFITSDNMKVGENVFHKWLLAEEIAENDTLLTLNINVAGLASTVINESICLGSVYNENGFTGLTESGVYKRKFPSSVGCDSVVTLNLTVIEPVKSFFADTICFGGKYVWNGKEYNKTGAYVETLTAVSGCDSIVTFALTVLDKVTTEKYVNICYGETYQFGSQTISATGKFEELFKTADGCDSLVTLYATVLPNYVDTINAVIRDGEEYNANGFKGLKKSGTFTLPLISVDGCDSTLTLNLTVLSNVTSEESITLCFGETYTFGTQEISKEGQYTEVFKAADGGDSTVLLTVTVLPDYRQTIEATICAGEVYNENGFENLRTTGVYKNELKSVEGCDSTITLNLTVLSGDTTRVEFEITTDDLPYEYEGLYYDKATKPGTYVDTIVIETENCEEVIVHTLIVEEGTAVDNVNSYDLVMVPNPVTVNGTLYINAEFTSEERDGLVVEVFNAIGQRVYVEYPSIYPIEITGLAERGMYIVRIIAGDGKSYTGKIIVE